MYIVIIYRSYNQIFYTSINRGNILLEKSHQYNLPYLRKCLKKNAPLFILKPFWVDYVDKKYVNVSETYFII